MTPRGWLEADNLAAVHWKSARDAKSYVNVSLSGSLLAWNRFYADTIDGTHWSIADVKSAEEALYLGARFLWKGPLGDA